MSKATKNMEGLRALAHLYHLDEKDILYKTRVYLKSYPTLKWLAKLCQHEPSQNYGYVATNIEESLQWIENLSLYAGQTSAPTGKQNRQTKLEDRHANQSLDEQTQPNYEFLAKLLESSVAKVSAYPQNGELYAHILENAYLTHPQMADDDLMEHLHFERTTYYAKKKEAVFCCALVIFGFKRHEIRGEYLPTTIYKSCQKEL